jgi:4-amino-4-deoxy-L-arabinose transferase-like glycosyltransferase
LLSDNTIQKRFYWLLGALAVILFVRLGAAPIYILDEAKNAQCAREMLQRNDFIVPTFNGELRTDKPALHYFFMILSYKIFGVNEFAARFFSAVMGLLTVLITFNYTRRSSNSITAFFAALVLTCSTHFLFEFRLSVPDPYLIFFITLGLFSAFSWLQKDSKLQLYIAATAFALATLAKGPVAVALPGLCLLLWVIFRKKWKILFTPHLISAAILFFAIALPWYILVHIKTNGAWTRGFFIEHNLNRFSDPQEGHGGLFIVTILFVVIGLLPFMSYLGEVIKNKRIVFQNELVAFSAIVFAAFIIFFSISSTKLPNYPMPCYPFAAICIGKYLQLLIEKRVAVKNYPLIILAVFTLLIPIAGYFALQQEAQIKNFSVITFFLLLTPIILLSYLFVRKNEKHVRNISAIAIAYTIFNIIGLQWVYPKIYSANPVAATLNDVEKADGIYGYQLYNPAFNFYLQSNITKADTTELRKISLEQPNAVLITREEYLNDLKNTNWKVVAKQHDLFELPTTVILKPNVP